MLLFALIMLSMTDIQAQNNVVLNIHHKLADAEFAMNQATENNLNQAFMATRLQYYISEISLTHDGGQKTTIEDLWILVDASENTSVELGAHDITALERVTLHVGVDADHNHLDPSSYPANHPLANQSPSMHWGWTSGYRFVAYEGMGGDNFDKQFQIHALGDQNYFTTDIDMNAMASAGVLAIDIDADYTRALENIAVAEGVNVHGFDQEAKQCLENFRDYVFSATAGSSSTMEIQLVSNFTINPNPVVDEMATISLDVNSRNESFDMIITSIEGKTMQRLENVVDAQRIDFSGYASGVYFANLYQAGQLLHASKIIVR